MRPLIQSLDYTMEEGFTEISLTAIISANTSCKERINEPGADYASRICFLRGLMKNSACRNEFM